MPGGIFVRISVKTLVTSVCRACFYSVCVCQWLYFFWPIAQSGASYLVERLQKYFCVISPNFFCIRYKALLQFSLFLLRHLNYHSAPLVQSSTNKADLDQEKNEVAKLMIIKYLQDGWRVAILMKCIVCICLLQ